MTDSSAPPHVSSFLTTTPLSHSKGDTRPARYERTYRLRDHNPLPSLTKSERRPGQECCSSASWRPFRSIQKPPYSASRWGENIEYIWTEALDDIPYHLRMLNKPVFPHFFKPPTKGRNTFSYKTDGVKKALLYFLIDFERKHKNKTYPKEPPWRPTCWDPPDWRVAKRGTHRKHYQTKCFSASKIYVYSYSSRDFTTNGGEFSFSLTMKKIHLE